MNELQITPIGVLVTILVGILIGILVFVVSQTFFSSDERKK